MDETSRNEALRDVSDALIEWHRASQGRVGAGAVCGITPAQGQVVHAVAIAGAKGETTGAVARRLRISSSAVTQLADGLVRAGLLQRNADPDDRRALRLVLTAQGRRLYRQFDAARVARMAELTRELDDEELLALRSMLGKLAGTSTE